MEHQYFNVDSDVRMGILRGREGERDSIRHAHPGIVQDALSGESASKPLATEKSPVQILTERLL